jgi:hypothetical protein
MPAKTDLPPVPPALVDVALIDAATCASAGGMSLASWRELVRNDIAPQPVIQQQRYTRWRMGDVRKFLLELPDRIAHEGDRAASQQQRRSELAQAGV